MIKLIVEGKMILSETEKMVVLNMFTKVIDQSTILSVGKELMFNTLPYSSNFPQPFRRRQQVTGIFPTMFCTLPKTKSIFFATFNFQSANGYMVCKGQSCSMEKSYQTFSLVYTYLFTPTEKQVLTTNSNLSQICFLGTTPVLVWNVLVNENSKVEARTRESD